jgi:3-hydroxybutyryl-CoA dehydrogenase
MLRRWLAPLWSWRPCPRTLTSRLLCSPRPGKAAPNAYLATNTSSLSVDSLAATLPEPERFIGLHFFNPVPASDLVEIVVGSATSARLTELAQVWVEDLGKTGITVADSPGFASSPLGVAIALEAMRMLDASLRQLTSTPR